MTMEDFRRPNHPDFLTSSELKRIEFSGIRHNSITNNIEIWTLGDLRAECRTEEEFHKAYATIFKIEEEN